MKERKSIKKNQSNAKGRNLKGNGEVQGWGRIGEDWIWRRTSPYQERGDKLK